MDDGDSAGRPTLVELMARVGFLLLHWSEAERLSGKVAPELAKVRAMRHHICHGLEAAAADPRDDREPWIRCRALDGGEVRYTWTDLDEAIRTLERFKGSRRA